MVFQLLQVLQFMESELQYRMTPLPELCQMSAGQCSGVLRQVFHGTYRELNSQKLPDAGSCMAAALRSSGELPASVRHLLAQLGQSLGRFDLEGQIRGIRSVAVRGRDQLQMLCQNRQERLRSYQTLGICAGAGLAILLL